MRAVRFHRQGPPECLQVDTIDDPHPGPGEVRVAIAAVGVNHLDVWTRREIPGVTLPRIPGADAAGTVAELGPGVTGLQVGDRVLLDPGLSCGSCRRCVEGDASLCATYRILGESCDGTYCEQIAVPARNCVPVPAGWSWAEAASFGLVALTAWRMCITRGRLTAGEDVLVLAGAAGVGVMCIQIARLAGCRVIATASTEAKRQLCRDLGADEAIDYTADGWTRRCKQLAPGGFDAVVDYVGAATWRDSIRLTRSGGRILTCGATTGGAPSAELQHVFFRQLSVIGSTMGSRADLEAALGLARRGLLRPVVGDVLPLAEAAEAHRRLEAREAAGKLVLQVTP